MAVLKSLRSLHPLILVSLGLTLIALTLNMPLFEWKISDISTNLPSEVRISASWTTKFGDSLESGSYNANDGSYIFHQVLVLNPNNGNSCSPEQLTSVIRRSQNDEMLERIALNVNQRIVRWLTGLTQTGQLTIAILLLICGVYIWWFTIHYKCPVAENFIIAVVATILLGFFINVWRLLVPETGVFVCQPELYGTLTFNAKLSKIHYETPVILLAGIFLELSALITILRQIRQIVFDRKRSLREV